MKRMQCLHYGFPRQPFVYKEPSKVEVPQLAPAVLEKKTLFETLEEAREVLKAAEEKLKKVEEYYGIEAQKTGKIVKIKKTARPMPEALRKSYADFFQRYVELWVLVKERSKAAGEWEGKGPERKRVRSEQDVIENTLSSIDELFGTIKSEHAKAETELEKKHKGDPLYAELGEMTFPESTLRPSPKPKKKVEGAPLWEEPEEKKAAVAPWQAEFGPKAKAAPKEAGKTPDQLIFSRAQNVIGKILNNFETGANESLTADEQTAIMILMNPGSFRKIKYGEREYILERDKTGKFVRIRDYVNEDKAATAGAADATVGGAANAGREEFFNPTIAFSGLSKDKKPLWPMTSKLDLVLAKVEKNQNEFKKQLDWLRSPKTPPGSRVSFDHLKKIERIDEKTERLTRFDLEAVKQADGTFRIMTSERVFLRKTVMEGDRERKTLLPDRSKPERNITRTFAEKEEVTAFAQDFFSADSGVVAEAATLEQQNEEMKLAEEKNLQKLQKAAESLADYYIAMKILGPQNKPDFQKALDRVVAFLRTMKKTDWFYKDKRLPFVLRLKDSELAILEDNPDYKQKKAGSRKYVVALSVPVQYEAPEGAKKVA